ncbi:MAG TPA: long-chain fatty acid--CoA ligase [Treponema sp.]|nr:long-chain fatty acid--CoA ligase [Treponema sp.]
MKTDKPNAPATVAEVLIQTVKNYPDGIAQLSKNSWGQYKPSTFLDLYGEAGDFAAGLASLGIGHGHTVGLISDNRREWLVADLAILGLRAADVPRGRDTLPVELSYILSRAKCTTVMAENLEQAEKILSILESVPLLERIIVLDPQSALPATAPKKIEILSYRTILDRGVAKRAGDPDFWERSLAAVDPEDIATIIFTSGTTGEPKGVPLTHRNFCHQLEAVPLVLGVHSGDIFLSVLPVWHVFERIVQYLALVTAGTLAYSKPIGKIMLHDFSLVRPMWMASVPRIWEAIKAGVYKSATESGGAKAAIFKFYASFGAFYSRLIAMNRGLMPQFKRRSRIVDWIVSCIPLLILWPIKALGDALVFSKVKAKLGGRFKAGISGGGSLPADIDEFFAAAGITLLNGYGLTETAPVIALRNWFAPVRLTLAPLPGTEIRIVDDAGKDCLPGIRGIIMARGKQIMKGYFNNPEATAKVLDADGWFNTGDLGVWTYDGNFAIRGRAKDTIVLMGGENVEPVPIEAKLRESVFIEHVMVVGQDQKYLGALIQIDTRAVEDYLKANAIPYIARDTLATMPEVRELINEEIALRINARNGFRAFERIGCFALLDRSFELGKELSAKQDMKRHVIADLYEQAITAMFR